MSEQIDVNEILARIQETAREHGVNLTYTNCSVYLKLLDYAEENSNIVTQYVDAIRINITTMGLAKYIGSISPRIITDSLKKFSECGIIKYTVNKPNPSTVVLYRRFFEDQ